jgi:hypothetical protein
MSSTLESVPPNPADRRNLLRPVAVAGVLWLLIAALFGLVALYILIAAPALALFYAVPACLFAAFGFGLIARRGIGLPLLSMILGTGLATLGVLGVLGASGQSTVGAGDVAAAVYGGAIVVSSIMGAWSTRMDPPILRNEQTATNWRSRILTGVFVAYVIIGTLILIVPLLFGLAWAGFSLFR